MTSRSSSRLFALSLLIGLCGWLFVAQGSAHADDFADHYNRGMQLYESKNYDEAVTELQKAYEIRQLPRLLLNMGTVYRKMGKAREALNCYEQYLKAEPNPPKKIRKELDEYIPQTRALLEKPAGKDGGAGSPAGTTPSPSGSGSVGSGTNSAGAATPAAPAGPKEPPLYTRPWFLGVVGGALGVVLIASIAGGVVAAQRKIPDDIQIIQLQLRF